MFKTEKENMKKYDNKYFKMNRQDVTTFVNISEKEKGIEFTLKTHMHSGKVRYNNN